MSCRQEWHECEVAGTNRYKFATWKFYYCLKWSCYLQNIFVNPCEFLGLCWVVFRSRNFADAKRKEVVCITLGFFSNSASGNGMWALGSGFEKIWAGKWDWYPSFRTLYVVALHKSWTKLSWPSIKHVQPLFYGDLKYHLVDAVGDSVLIHYISNNLRGLVMQVKFMEGEFHNLMLLSYE